MKVYSLETFCTSLSPITATIGMFDGVHCGHQYLIGQLTAHAKSKKALSMVLTFTSHPKQLFYPERSFPLLSTVEEKVALLEKNGVDYCLLLDFNKQLADMTAMEFTEKILHDTLHIQTLLLGYDNRFGKKQHECFDNYVEYGRKCEIDVINADSYSPMKTTISSSLIRRYLAEGEIEQANKCLGYEYGFTGKVVKGFQIGRTLGFPTANILLPSDKLLPLCGVYAIEATIGHTIKKGMLNIGTRPTIHQQGALSVEAHLFDFSDTIYGEEICIRLKHFLRPEYHFTSKEELQQQLLLDKKRILSMF